MDWKNLKAMECPKCGEPLISELHNDSYHCECGFSITRLRLEEVIASMDRPKKPKYYDADRIDRSGWW